MELSNRDIAMGIVPGPVWDNGGDCRDEDYVLSCEVCYASGPPGNARIVHETVDVYVVDYPGNYGQSIVLFSRNSVDESYSSLPLRVAVTIQWDPWVKVMEMLSEKGRLVWERGK